MTFIFHGGEPTLVGCERFDRWCQTIRSRFDSGTRVRLALQTNGVLLNANWAAVISKHQVDVAVSLDGPASINDASRVDHQGRGTHVAVLQGLQHLKQSGIALQILSVIPFGADGREVHRHLVSLGCSTINYLFPDFTYDTVNEERQKFGPTPCADFLIPAFDEWWYNDTMNVRVLMFWNIARLILGGDSEIDLFGNNPLSFLFVETDGSIEALDVLKICRPGIARTSLNVLNDQFADVAASNRLLKDAIFVGMPLPTACLGCPEETTCSGGYLPHRFSQQSGFDNPSVWCADTLKLFAHIRERLGVTSAETNRRREVINRIALETNTL